MKQTRLILVGGFLGAGKTTLLWETAVRLMNKGLRVGLITNDQAPELVDSELLKLIINARVETTPELLDQMVREVLIGMIDGKYEEEVVAWRFLQPGRPNPTHRFVEIIKS